MSDRLETSYQKLNLGCGTDQREGDEWLNVDLVAECDPDLVVDLDAHTWPFVDNSAEHIFAAHVFEHLSDVERGLRECARILQPGGTLELRLPMGLDMQADPDHKPVNEWTWRTPEFFTGKRHWDIDVGLSVVHRDVTLWVQQPGVFGWLQKQKIRWLRNRHGIGEWCFGLESVSGEFRVVFEKNENRK